MVTRIGEWIELSFWQIAVRVLSGARPFSHGLHKVQHSVAKRAAGRLVSNIWVICGAGWLIGLLLGIWLAGWF